VKEDLKERLKTKKQLSEMREQTRQTVVEVVELGKQATALFDRIQALIQKVENLDKEVEA